MSNTAPNFVPVLTSEAGFCLTNANWQEVQVGAVSYYLDSLLIKPGVALLKQITNLASYVAWNGTIVLNASRLRANKEGVFALTSPFDGSKLKLNYAELFAIINQLKPDVLIVPEKTMHDAPDLIEQLDKAIMPFIVATDLADKHLARAYGVYFNSAFASMNSPLIAELKRWSHIPRYVAEVNDLELLKYCKAEQVEFIESDEPAKMALAGTVYSQDGMIDLTDSQTTMQFALIDSECSCPTCTQQFTKAYLHHLYLNTPLLAQRFLIQHNIHAW